MVGTRNRGEADETPSSTTASPATGDTRARPAVSRALRKLQIDANPALRGERDDKNGRARIYHWRGAVYEVQEDTPQEWLDSQPNRYLKRKAEQMVSSSSPASGAEEERSPPAKRARRQVQKREESITPAAVKRGRGRPRKYPIPDASPSLKPIPQQRSTPQHKPASQHKRQPSTISRHDSVAQFRGTKGTWAKGVGRSSKERARAQGYNVDPISWSEWLTNQIMRFCALQARLRELRKELQMANDLEKRIDDRDRREMEEGGEETAFVVAEDDDTAAGAAIEEEYESSGHDFDEHRPQGPITPEPDVVTSPVGQDDTVEDKPTIIHSDDDTTSDDPSRAQLSRLLGTWKRRLSTDENVEGSNELSTSQEGQGSERGRAEYHIFKSKVNALDQDIARTERMEKELTIIRSWEVLKDGRTMTQEEDRAPVPRRCSDADGTAATDHFPQRLPLYID